MGRPDRSHAQAWLVLRCRTGLKLVSFVSERQDEGTEPPAYCLLAPKPISSELKSSSDAWLSMLHRTEPCSDLLGRLIFADAKPPTRCCYLQTWFWAWFHNQRFRLA